MTKGFSGTYIGTSKSLIGGKNQYTLILNTDGTFTYEEKVFEANPKCSGLWKIADNHWITLKCNEEEDVSIVLSNSYMNECEYQLKNLGNGVLLNNKILLYKK